MISAWWFSLIRFLFSVMLQIKPTSGGQHQRAHSIGGLVSRVKVPSADRMWLNTKLRQPLVASV
jgi:hypothetical protein